jgi:hypothetical protein
VIAISICFSCLLDRWMRSPWESAKRKEYLPPSFHPLQLRLLGVIKFELLVKKNESDAPVGILLGYHQTTS